jgi:hypothetical protein
MVSWRERWSWWREFQSLGRRQVSEREQRSTWTDERKLRAARFYLAVTHPNIVAALIGAIAAIGMTILAVLLKVALQY